MDPKRRLKHRIHHQPLNTGFLVLALLSTVFVAKGEGDSLRNRCAKRKVLSASPKREARKESQSLGSRVVVGSLPIERIDQPVVELLLSHHGLLVFPKK